MKELVEKLYTLYLALLDDLVIGYPLSNKNMDEIWELIHIIDFMMHGHPSEKELLWIADTYENVEALLTDVNFEF